MKVYLVGLRGSGKTTVGRRLAELLGLPFADQDALVEERAGKPISRIFAEDGEEAFRRLEGEVLEELAAGGPVVVATGGGVVLRSENRRLLRRGLTVYLQAPPELLARRISADPSTGSRRPPLTDRGDPAGEMHLLHEQRDGLYREVARRTVDASRPLEEVVQAVLEALGGGRAGA